MANTTELDFSTLLASSVHDMKNTVGMMIVQLSQLQSGVGEREELEVLGMQASQLNQSLIQLLALYKLEQQLYLPPSEEVYLDEFCEDFAAHHQSMLEALQLKLSVDNDVDTEWTLDPALIQSALATLVTNILQLKQQRQLPVSCVKLRVDTAAVAQASWLRISLEDDGPGFAPERWGHFQPQRSGIEFSTGSSGLGLYFSHLTATHHRQGEHLGFIELGQSETLGGARVSFYIP